MAHDALRQAFNTREELAAYIADTFGETILSSHSDISPFVGGRKAALAQLQQMQPLRYGRTRNFYHGDVTRLSPYIRHGILTLAEVRDAAIDIANDNANDSDTDSQGEMFPTHRKQKAHAPAARIEKLLQELAWRDFWRRLYGELGEDALWQDQEPYKTGFTAEDYADTLPDDIANGNTGVAAIDHFIADLLRTGYMHNHTRMYVAAYVVHWRRVKWQAGARWFLTHLIDGDIASNNLSWQWVASTFANKPYIFNLENVRRYCEAGGVNCNAQDNAVLDASYDTLSQRLFPHGQGGNA